MLLVPGLLCLEQKGSCGPLSAFAPRLKNYANHTSDIVDLVVAAVGIRGFHLFTLPLAYLASHKLV